MRDKPIEYFILGQHFLGNEINETYSGEATTDEHELERYCDQTIEAMNTGLFTYLAHPDLFNYIGETKIYQKHMRRLCREAKACKMPLEINLMGISEKRHYPSQRFWEMAAEEGCVAVLGCDAHDPQALLNKDLENQALKLANYYGIHVLPTVSLRPIL